MVAIENLGPMGLRRAYGLGNLAVDLARRLLAWRWTAVIKWIWPLRKGDDNRVVVHASALLTAVALTAFLHLWHDAHREFRERSVVTSATAAEPAAPIPYLEPPPQHSVIIAPTKKQMRLLPKRDPHIRKQQNQHVLAVRPGRASPTNFETRSMVL